MAAKRTTRAATPAGSKSKSNGRKAPPQPALSHDELRREVRRLLDEAAWLSATELKKRLPKSQATDGLAIAHDLAARGELFRYAKGKTEHLFARDPIATLERLIPGLLDDGALPLSDLAAKLDRASPGLSQVLPEWLKRAVASGQVFEHARVANGATKPKQKAAKTYSTRPDLRVLLKKSLAALTTDIKTTDASNVARDEVLRFIATELGVSQSARSSPVRATAAKSSSETILRDAFLAALRRLADRNGKGALLPVRQLRAEAQLEKQIFDMTALALSREGAIVLHHHDHAGSLPEGEREQLIRDTNGTHYVGIALRRPS
jgi:hypothetical protein